MYGSLDIYLRGFYLKLTSAWTETIFYEWMAKNPPNVQPGMDILQ